jgi:hypothetical protein
VSPCFFASTLVLLLTVDGFTVFRFLGFVVSFSGGVVSVSGGFVSVSGGFGEGVVAFVRMGILRR